MMDEDASLSSTQPRPERTRRPRPNSIAVDTSIMMNGPGSPRRPPPSAHLPGSPSHQLTFDSSASASPTKFSHRRSQTLADSPRRLNRLSMSFPVLPPTTSSSRPTSWANSPIMSPVAPSPASTESNFLTQLASQERKVLELKEALRQAELELDKLKKRWTTREAQKKAGGPVKRVTAMQPLSANALHGAAPGREDDADGSSEWLQREMERRKMLLSGIKTSNRKVFSGSKHTRTLSLLSPEKSNFPQPFPQPTDLQTPEENPYRSPTHTSKAHEDTLSQLEGQPRDAILRTGKQMANDIKDGLWTFFEDIRQATIGEEATMSPADNNTPTANGKAKPTLKRSNTTGASSTRTVKSVSKNAANGAASAPRRDTRHDTLIDIGGSFWRENGIETTPVQTSKQHKKSQSVKVGRQAVAKPSARKPTASPIPNSDVDISEAWDSWDTPIKSQSSTPQPPQTQMGRHPDDDETSSSQADSASDGIGTPLTDEHSRQTPRTSTSSVAGKRNSIPWPDLEKLTPSSLKRTASHLMREWEKSLTPSPSVSEIEGLALDSNGTPSASGVFGSSVGSVKTDKSD